MRTDAEQLTSDVLDIVTELREAWEQRQNDLLELLQELDAKVDQLQDSVDELGGLGEVDEIDEN